MRHILIDRARRRLRVRHGEKVENLPLYEIEIATPPGKRSCFNSTKPSKSWPKSRPSRPR
jgi:hypothetical protein